jgi:hypothetical protein
LATNCIRDQFTGNQLFATNSPDIVNGHSTTWQCPECNDRGRQPDELINSFNLSVENKPSNIYTYEREGMGKSNIDVTLTSTLFEHMVHDWCVCDITDSDHNVITYTLKLSGNLPDRATNTEHGCNNFNINKADWVKFTHSLMRYKDSINDATIDSHANSIIETIQKAVHESMPLQKTASGRICKQTWWSQVLSDPKRVLNRMRRLDQNRTMRPTYNRLRNEHLGKIKFLAGQNYLFIKLFYFSDT